MADDGIGSALGMFGGAVGDLFGAAGAEASAQGDLMASQSYQKAEQIALANARYSDISTEITENQLHRQVMQVVGKQEAQVAAGGVQGGSALDLKRSSLMQGNLASAVMNIQGVMQKNSFLQQANAYEGQAEAAASAAIAEKAKSSGMGIGALFKVGAGLFSLFGA